MDYSTAGKNALYFGILKYRKSPMPKIQATEIRSGALIERDGKLWRVMESRHVHIGGRGGACMQIVAKELEGGAKSNLRLRTDEKIERPFVEQKTMRFLYRDGDGFVFMDEENFEQTTLDADLMEGREGFILPDTAARIAFFEGRVIGVELPTSAALTVVQTEPQQKNATAAAGYKPATMETGITVMVPPFVGEGEKVRVSTDTGEYLERGE